MGRKTILNSEVAHLEGLAFGSEASHLMNVYYDPSVKLYRLDDSLIVPEFENDPQKIFTEDFFDKIKESHENLSAQHRANREYETGIKKMFGKQLNEMVFTQEEKPAVTFSYFFDPDQNYKHFHTAITPSLVKVEEELSFNKANKLLQSGDEDIRLSMIYNFYKNQNIVPPVKTVKNIDFYNIQAIMAAAAIMTQKVGRSVFFNQSVEGMMRVSFLQDDSMSSSYESKSNYLSTSDARRKKVGSDNCKTFLDVLKKDAAIINGSGLRHFCISRKNAFTDKQCSHFGKVQHQRTNLGIKPMAMARRAI